MKQYHWIAVGIVVLAAAASGQQQSPVEFSFQPGGSIVAQNLQARAIASHLSVAPGEEFHVAVELQIADGWVYYSPDPGPDVIGGRLDVQAEPFVASEPLWLKDKPKTTTLGDESITNNTYSHKTYIYVPFRVPADAAEGEHEIVLSPGGQICEMVCVDIHGLTASVGVRISAKGEVNPAWTGPVASGLGGAMTADQLKALHAGGAKAGTEVISARAAEGAVWWGLGLALLAGLTLNIMPCVLPVIPLRILGIVAMAHDSRRRFVTLGLAFAAGMLLFFAGVAGVSLTLRLATDQAINISDHFQYPAVRIALAMVMVALAANLFGAFNITVPSKLAAAEGAAQREGHLKSIGMGFMMAVLATPCSFAYLLTAMAWAQLQPPLLGTIAILTVGVGMAAPHAMLAAFPKLVSKLPKPGRWMELFKQSMGFALLPVSIWLISTLSDNTWPFWLLSWAVVLAFSLWAWGSWVRYDAPLRRKVAVRALAVALAVGTGMWMLPQPKAVAGGVEFEPFDEARLAEARKAGQVVLVKVTASWCLECKVIDYRIFKKAATADELRKRGVLAMVADVTDRNSVASKWLRDTIGGAPPQTIVYSPGEAPPRRMVGGFSVADLRDMLDQAAAKP